MKSKGTRTGRGDTSRRFRNRRTRLALAALGCALFATPSVGAAGVSPADAAPAKLAEAKERFMAGKNAMHAKAWTRAEAEFRASLDLVDSPNCRLELARTLREEGKSDQAWIEYGRTVEEATKLGGKDDRYANTAEAATSERGEIEGKLALLAVTVAHAPPNATLKVGGRVVPQGEWSAPILVAPGAMDIVVMGSAGQELARTTVSASLGQKTQVAVDAQAAPRLPEARDRRNDGEPDFGASEASAAESQPAAAKLRPYAYIAGGVGVAGLATFAIFGLMNNATYSDLQNACHPGCPTDKHDEIETGRAQQLIANVGLGVGVAGLAAGAALWFLSKPAHGASVGTALVIAPGFVGMRGSL
jgi:hypothetical protein